MKTLLVLTMMLGGVLLYAAPAEVSFAKIKVSAVLENAPLPDFRNNTGSKGGSPQIHNRYWLMVRVEFTPGKGSEKAVPDTDSKRGSAKSARQAAGVWIDNPVLHVSVAYPAEFGKTKDQTRYGLLEGETKFWAISLDGRRHAAIMLVPPQLLDRYMAVKTNAKEAVAVAGDFKVEATFTNSAGKSLGSGYWATDFKNDAQGREFFTRLREKVGGAAVKNGVWSRDVTPWYLHHFNDFDLIRPAGY